MPIMWPVQGVDSEQGFNLNDHKDTAKYGVRDRRRSRVVKIVPFIIHEGSVDETQ